MKDNKNLYWKIKEIAQEYKKENPNWIWDKCLKKAEIIYKELNKLNFENLTNDKLFFKMNTPFSFYDLKNDEFSDTFYDFENRE